MDPLVRFGDWFVRLLAQDPVSPCGLWCILVHNTQKKKSVLYSNIVYG